MAKPVGAGIVGKVRRRKADGMYVATSPTGARSGEGRTEVEAVAALIKAIKDNPIQRLPKRRVCS